MNARHLLLTALIFPAIFLSTRQPRGAAPSVAAMAAATRDARLDQARAYTASIDARRVDITPADLSGVSSLERLRSGVFLGVRDNDAGAAENASLPAGRVNLFMTQVGGAWTPYAESGGRVYAATRAIESPHGPPGQTFPRGSGCWWLWLITRIEVCL
jgi:hypothetical protein